MRKIASITAAVAVSLITPALQAETLPSLTVPTFSMQFTSYREDSTPHWPNALPAITLQSTNALSTNIRLDTVAGIYDVGHFNNMGTTVAADMHFEAAEGYRITAISFSATVQGVLELPEIPAWIGDDLFEVHWGRVSNNTMATAHISPDGAPQRLYNNWNITTPVSLGQTVQNATDLRAFDYSLDLIAYALAEASYFVYWGPDGYLTDTKGYGNARIHYTDAVLTVHTQPLVPVPEPGQWAMLAGGLLLMAGMQRHARRKNRTRMSGSGDCRLQ